MSSESAPRLVAALAELLIRRGQSISAAESCTGGMIAAAATSLAGSSSWFERGYVTYSNAAKTEALGVASTLIGQHGAVSEACAAAMAEGCLAHSHADFALSVTGIAGPAGGSPDKPVGTVCFAWAGKSSATRSDTCHFSGDRAAVRDQSLRHSLEGMLAFIEGELSGG